MFCLGPAWIVQKAQVTVDASRVIVMRGPVQKIRIGPRNGTHPSGF
jgi:hypothetical protein